MSNAKYNYDFCPIFKPFEHSSEKYFRAFTDNKHLIAANVPLFNILNNNNNL